MYFCMWHFVRLALWGFMVFGVCGVVIAIFASTIRLIRAGQLFPFWKMLTAVVKIVTAAAGDSFTAR